MVITRKQGKKTFPHVVNVLLGADLDSRLTKCIQNEVIDNVIFLLEMTYDDISNIHYRDKNGEKIDADNSEKNLIRILQAYNKYRNDLGDPIHDWLSVTQEMFNKYRTEV